MGTECSGDFLLWDRTLNLKPNLASLSLFVSTQFSRGPVVKPCLPCARARVESGPLNPKPV